MRHYLQKLKRQILTLIEPSQSKPLFLEFSNMCPLHQKSGSSFTTIHSSLEKNPLKSFLAAIVCDIFCDQWRIYIVKFWTRAPPGGPNSFNFMQFLGKFGKIVCWHLPLESWRPLLGEILDPPLVILVLVIFYFCHQTRVYFTEVIYYNTGQEHLIRTRLIRSST